MDDEKRNALRKSYSLFSCIHRAIRVKFFRNGDKYFTGFVYPISFNRYKDFDCLLKDLSNSTYCDKSVMPCGVRSIFDIHGNRIRSVHEMEESTCYVCSGTNTFIPLNYVKDTSDPKWKTTKYFIDQVVPVAPLQNKQTKIHVKSPLSFSSKKGSQQRRRPNSAPHKPGAKIINVLRNSTGRPRRVFQWLLNPKTAPTFTKVLDDLSTLMKLDSGFIKHLFFLDGREATCLKDLFGDDSNFIAVATDTVDRSCLVLTPQEQSFFDKNKRSIGCLPNEGQNSQKFTDIYLVGNEIGVGNFAVVKECKDKRKNQVMAVKIIDKKKCDKYIGKIYQEIDIIKKLRHTNVIELVNSFETSDYIYLVMDLSQDGNMVDFILHTQNYSEQDLSGMIHNIAAGLFYLHSIHIIHRDIKFENILIDQDKSGLMRLKICDFGLAVEVETGELPTSVCGSPHYMAPEVFTQKGYTSKVDMWSLGVIFHVLLSGHPPFISGTSDFNEVFDMILQNEVDKSLIEGWKHVSYEAKQLLLKMLTKEAIERASAAEVLSSPWVSEDNVAHSLNLWPVVSHKVTSFLDNNKQNNIYQCDFLAKTSLDKDSNFFESED